MKRAVIVAAAVCLIVGNHLRAQSGYELVHTFSGNQGRPVAGLVEGIDGRLYGTTEAGGFHGKGTVFATDASGNATTLHEFDGQHGAAPRGRLLLASDNNFYGTTISEGPSGWGTVFRITPDGNITTVVAFDDHDFGASPHGGLVEVAGVLYGTTINGGTGLSGTVFSVALDGSNFTSYPFTGGNGAAPSGDLVAKSDGVYGTAQGGGEFGGGVVFRLTSGGALEPFASFNPDLHDRAPIGGFVLGDDGNLYGMTQGDGVATFGTLFRVTPAGVLSTVVTFTGDNGSTPAGSLSAFGNAVYGTTRDGGGFGTVFRLSLADDSLETLWSFGLLDGAAPSGGVIQASSGSLFGTTSGGGPGGLGTVFQLMPGGSLNTTLAFTGSEGAIPSGQLVQATDGNFYGTTLQGGAFGLGTVFRLSPEGVFTTLASFNGDNGEIPSGGLVQAGDALYGTTETGGFGEGTVFRVDLATGELTTIAVFDSFAEQNPTGAGPRGGLTVGRDGHLYGTTEFGPGFTAGSVFRVTLDGMIETLAIFTGDNGGFPTSGVIQSPNGDLYGVTEEGGEFFSGTIFRVSLLNGSIVTVKSFDGVGEGALPTSRPALASDGGLYGTTFFGGDADQGVIYRLASDDTFSVVASFDGVNGSMPFGEGVVEGVDKKLYGTTSGGGSGFGVVYRVDEGTIVPIHLFDGVSGERPNTSLIRASDGSLYGTTEEPQGGTVFRIVFEEEQPATLSVAPASAIYGGSTTLFATLSSASGPVVGVEVGFRLNGVAVGAAITNDAGVATLEGVPVAGLDAISYPGAIEASAAGLGLTATADLSVAKAVPALSVIGGTFVYDGAPHAAAATATGVAGEDLGPVAVTYNGSAAAPTEPASYNVGATYSGSANYEAATATASLVILPPAPGVAGLVAAYGFNEGAGNIAADSSGRGHHGVISGAKYVGGRFGGALRFDGQNDWVTIADAADFDLGSGMTLEAWVKPTSLYGWRTVVIKEKNDSSQAYAIYASEDMPQPSGYVNIGGNYQGVTSPKSLGLYAWSHVTVTYDGSMLRLYINGAEADRRAVSGNVNAGKGPLRIGGNSIWGEYFNGLIDEVRVYSVALSPADIKRDMDTPVAHESQAPLVSIESPTDGAVLSGTPTIKVLASDNVAIAGVQLSVDDKLVGGTLIEAPYTMRLDAANGLHTIKAIARDTAGNVTESAPVTVRILNKRVADYRFDEGSGRNIIDASGRGNHGTMSLLGVSRAIDAVRGKVLNFAGFGGMVSVPDSDSLDLTTGITLEAWVKPTALGGWRTVVLKEGVDVEVYSIYANEEVAAPTGYVYVNSAYEAVRGNRRLTLSAWTHVAMTYDGTTLRFFVNGEEKESRQVSGSALVTNGQLSIGGNTIWGEWFRGQMDDVRIYDVAIGEAQIKADMSGIE
jgi:uncharacterized repeat protein (TIGR03803 family)